MRVFIYIGLLMLTISSYACEITMGYRTTARTPNINASPDNGGVYFDLYYRAAKDIGCKLKVVRQAKKRILNGLMTGEIDFYPGLTFTEGRSEYVYFFPSGLPSWDVGVTRHERVDLVWNDLKSLIYIGSLGSPRHDDKFTDGQSNIKFVNELDIKRAVELILTGRADFYRNEIGDISYYLRGHPRKDELRYQYGFGDLTELTTGFSRQSQHYVEETNSGYDASADLNFNNFPTRLKASSRAYQFSEALKALREKGFTDELYLSYYGVSVRALYAQFKKGYGSE